MLNASATPTCTYTLISYYTTDFVYIYMYLFRAPLKCNNEYLNTTILTALTCMYTCIRLGGAKCRFWQLVAEPLCNSMYIQYRSYARHNERAFAFACNCVCLRVRTLLPPLANAFVSEFERVRLRVRTRSLLLTNAFTSTHERIRLPTNANANAVSDGA